jgi:DNA-binding MarR family transcriptional regulator
VTEGTRSPELEVEGDTHTLDRRVSEMWRELRHGPSIQSLQRYVYESGPHRLHVGLARALEVIVRHGPCRVSDLAEHLGVEPSTASRAVGRLVDMGLAERRHSEHDGRAVDVDATDAGKAVFDDIVRRGDEAMREILSTFSVAERRRFATDLEQLVESINQFVAQNAAS